jgi:uncharacterized protein (DUF1810 family)
VLTDHPLGLETTTYNMVNFGNVAKVCYALIINELLNGQMRTAHFLYIIAMQCGTLGNIYAWSLES